MSASSPQTKYFGWTLPELQLSQLLNLCLERWRTIAIAMALSTLVALAFWLVTPPFFRATAKLVIDPRPQRILNVDEVLPGLTADASAIETQVLLISSGSVAQRVLREMKGSNAGPLTDLDVQDFLSRLTVTRQDLTYVVNVTYTGRDRKTAADIANRVVRAYIDEEARSANAAAQHANVWLQERIKSLAPEMLALEKAIQEFRAANNLIAIGEQTVTERGIISFMAELGLARAVKAEAQARLELDSSKSTVSLQSRDASDIASAKVAIMERDLSAMTSELHKDRMQAIKLFSMERELAAIESLYESLLKRQKETEAQENVVTVNARFIEEALPPTYPYWPSKLLLVAAGLLAGFTIGLLMIVGEALRLESAGKASPDATTPAV